MIDFKIIKSGELSRLIYLFDKKIDFINKQFNIELKTYGNIIRVALSTIQLDVIKTLIERVKINKELERALDNAGGYTIEYIGENNPKVILIEILNYLSFNPHKQIDLISFLQNLKQRINLLCDLSDTEYIKNRIRNNKVELISFAIAKRISHNKPLVLYSFNGIKDFEFIQSLNTDITLIVYEEEFQFYQKQINNRIKLIESEIKSEGRFKICGIHYEEVPEIPIYLSRTIEDIVNRLDNLGTKAYEGYKYESDLLLDEIPEKIIYKIISDNKCYYLDSNDAIYNILGDLKKVPNVRIGDKIRIYPKEELAENLYQVAVETEPEIFGKIEEHSIYWQDVIKILSDEISIERLYIKLKANGLRVLPKTVECYLKGQRKFPMFNNDLRAIFSLYYKTIGEDEMKINDVLIAILKSKMTYNSTMIALGRGIKQELGLFLREKRIGEILAKRGFNSESLQKFIDKEMPIITVLNSEIYFDTIEQLELYNSI